MPPHCDDVLLLSHKIYYNNRIIYFDNYFAAELGDFDEENHTLAGISEFRFVPDQTEEMEIQIFEEFKKYRLV